MQLFEKTNKKDKKKSNNSTGCLSVAMVYTPQSKKQLALADRSTSIYTHRMW